ncbi:MAG: ABC transporter substrate-binding protein [Candidatus Symbiobacter sp.]|nr:ABC transporter substrate-binding protein [Candidatus Symbiobacter sp.]
MNILSTRSTRFSNRSGKNLTRALFGSAAALLIGLAQPANAAELAYWSMWNEPEPQAVALKQVMDAYTKAHPETTFKVTWNGRQNQTKSRAALQAGTKIDFMDTDGDQLAGGLQHEGLGYDLAGDLDAATRANLLPHLLDLYADGKKIYQAPYILNPISIWYNKDLMSKIGGTIPKTFDDLLALCKKADAAGKHAFVIEGNVAFYNISWFSHYVARLKGPNSLEKIFSDKSGKGWHDPAVMQAANAMQSLWANNCFAKEAKAYQYPAGQQTIALGDTVGELVGSWLPVELAQTAGPNFNWGTYAFPAVKGGKGKASDMEVGMLSFFVLKSSPNAKEAAQFIKFALSEPAQKMIVATGDVGGSHKAVTWPVTLADSYALATKATGVTPFSGGLNVKHAEFTSGVLYPEFNKMFLGNQTPEQMIATLATKTKEYWASRM